MWEVRVRESQPGLHVEAGVVVVLVGGEVVVVLVGEVVVVFVGGEGVVVLVEGEGVVVLVVLVPLPPLDGEVGSLPP